MVGRWRSLEASVWQRSSRPRISSDAREIGRGSEMSGDVRGMLIDDEVVAYWLRRAVELGDDDGEVISPRTILKASERKSSETSVTVIPTLVEEQVRQQVQQIVETQQRTQRQQVEDQVGTTLSSIIPTLVAGLDEWYRGGKKGPPPVPSFTGSNSHNVEPSVSPQAATMVSPAAPTLVAPAAPTLVAPAAPTLVSPAAPTLVSPAAPLLQLNAPVAADNTPPGTAPTSGHSISCTPAAGGASTLAELDAITSSAVDVPCTLLHFVNGELIDVAKAKIVQPSNRQLHGRPMQPDVYRIQLVRVLSGYDDVVPPFQPHGADEDEVLTLQHCFNWSMVWPKSQIRLGARGTTPQTTPPALPAPSHGKTTPTVPPSADEDMQMAQDEDMQMAQDPNDGPYEDSTFANLDCNFDFGVDYDLSSQPSQAAAEGKTYCNKRRLFSSQETPPAADFTETQPKAEVRSVISPNTLKKACAEENAVPVNTKPKGRKRKKKDDKSASQPAPIRAQDGPPVPKNIEARVHVSGERMLIKRLYDAAPGPMRSLVDGIQFMEERRIREKDHGYPVYIAKVPSGHGFVDSDFAAKIFLRYDDIFAMLNSYPLHYTFIRLYSLSKAMRIIRDNTPGIAIADPFYMCAVHLATAGDRAVASEYLKGFFLANQKKYNLLLPVFPEDNTCTLISVTPRHSMATYLDADGKSSTDYTNVKAVLDDALNGYVKAKGHMERPNVRYGKHVFKHQTKFPCVKKPPSSTKDAYYALYHMNKFIRDQQQLTLPEHLRDWANKLARVPDDGIKQDFFRIQTEFCEIIHQDVIRSAGEFYAGYQPSNSDIDTMLQMQGDDYRSWMCLKKGGDMTWYVVYKGKVPGVYNDWEECRRQVHRFSGNNYKGSEGKIFVAKNGFFLEKEFLTKEVTGRKVELDEVDEPSLIDQSSAVPEEVPVQPAPIGEEANDDDHETSNEEATEPRRSTRERTTPDWYDPCLNVMIVDNNDEDPATYEEAMMSPDSNKWKEAMKSEMGSMYDNKVWTLVDLPDSPKAVENKWIFKRKTDADGNITVYKARLVAKGFRQIQGVDYDETFSPVAKLKSVRILLAIAAFFDYEIWQMDVKTAFLNGDIEEELYIVQPKGFVDPKNADKVCKLQRSIYGLKQASRSWNLRFDRVIKDFGFIRTHGEACIYKKVSGSSVAFLILYVDDILLIGNDIELLSNVKGYLNKSFSMKDLGEAAYILGIKIYRDRSRRLIGLSQSTYLDKILKKFRMDESKKGFLPMLPGKVLSKTQGPATADERERMSKIPYASAVGSIMYAMLCTRPDIAHVVSLTSRYQSDPGMEHWTTVKNILKYLKRTKDMFLCYGGDQELVVTSYTDASWNTDPDDSKSQSGYVFILNGAAVSWSSSKQCTVAKSST
ncbi:hypothetical protein QYE76_065842 [Lolium multiflorum]|uniref:Uncharacterized protein n=1 Tax=Lolium multiflorum TaxID=4521 RepID=A0AAD8S9J1_LOLMU|nr:hypothetical protein QYE76_065842 [Lolium multiflorum]